MRRNIMKKAIALFTALMMCSLACYSTDLILNNGATFKNIEVTQTTPIGINFVCNGSAGWADFRDMPINEATSFGYDPMKAAAFEKQLQDNQGAVIPDNALPDYIPQSELTNTDSVPLTPDNTIAVYPGDSIPYDTQVVYGCGAPQWICWNGCYYPYNYWHHWYWNNRWAYCNGRYCPVHYYHQHGLWHGNRYYSYRHNLQGRPAQGFRSALRTNGRSFERRAGGGLQHMGGGGGHFGGGGGHMGGGGGHR